MNWQIRKHNTTFVALLGSFCSCGIFKRTYQMQDTIKPLRTLLQTVTKAKPVTGRTTKIFPLIQNFDFQYCICQRQINLLLCSEVTCIIQSFMKSAYWVNTLRRICRYWQFHNFRHEFPSSDIEPVDKTVSWFSCQNIIFQPRGEESKIKLSLLNSKINSLPFKT
jgi:hypothetical protein